LEFVVLLVLPVEVLVLVLPVEVLVLVLGKRTPPPLGSESARRPIGV
jgi:hypothetical protein